MTQCACERCNCAIETTGAVTLDSKTYCSQACADGHPQGQGCGHSGCVCA
jgi:hypothetical protein